MVFPRACIKCKESFVSNSQYNKVCPACMEVSFKKVAWPTIYNAMRSGICSICGTEEAKRTKNRIHCVKCTGFIRSLKKVDVSSWG